MCQTEYCSYIFNWAGEAGSGKGVALRAALCVADSYTGASIPTARRAEAALGKSRKNYSLKYGICTATL